MVQETRSTRTETSQGYLDPVVAQRSTTTVRRASTGAQTLSRVIVFIFGLIQLVIALRIVGLLIDANRDNAIVRFVYDTSQIFVAPFEGILNTDALRSGGSVLDVAAIVALVGWTIIEILVLAGIRALDREP